MIDQKVMIEHGTTAIRIFCNNGGRISEWPSVSIYPFLRSTLTEYDYDYRLKHSYAKYYYFRYNKDNGTLYMPVNSLSHLINYFKSNGVKYDIEILPTNPSANITLVNSGLFEDRNYQIDAISFLVKNENHMRVLELQTGKGKSYIAARAIMEIGKRALISVPASLVTQWNDALCSMCESKIGIIRGSDTVYNLIKANYETDIDIFLASVTTLQGYAAGIDIYNEAPPLREFLKNLLIGTKVVDEFHINFAANVMVDIQSNIENNLYLSATGLRSSKNSQTIFRKVYPDSIRYDGVKYDKYVNITECRYSLGDIEEKKVVTDRGYSQYRYEKLIMRSSRKLNDFIGRVLYPTMEMFFINKYGPGQKVLILVGLKDFAETLTAWCRDTYPELVSIAFLHGVDDDELEKSDIIVSTIGSAGTGRDIKGLRTVILFSSFGSEALTLQTIGRLRKMEDTPEFVYLLNTKIKSHHQHCKKRRDIYKDIGKSFQVVEID